MDFMTSSDSTKVVKASKIRQLDFLRQKNETKIERKKRVKPKKPKIKEPIKKVKIKVNNKINTKINNIKIKPFKVQSKQIDISAVSSLSGAQVEAPQQQMQIYDANSLQAIKRVEPQYPRKARIRRKSGFVELGFSINKNGLVSNVKVISSKPKGLFERSSINAIKKWKFKRSESSKNATITFNFRLQR